MSKNSKQEQIRFHGNVLYVGERHFEYPIDIKLTLQIDRRVLVLLSLRGDKTPERNILCYDLDGTLLWEIEEFRPDLVGEGRQYGNLRMSSDGKIIAYNTRGFNVDVDLETGKISNFDFVK